MTLRTSVGWFRCRAKERSKLPVDSARNMTVLDYFEPSSKTKSPIASTWCGEQQGNCMPQQSGLIRTGIDIQLHAVTRRAGTRSATLLQSLHIVGLIVVTLLALASNPARAGDEAPAWFNISNDISARLLGMVARPDLILEGKIVSLEPQPALPGQTVILQTEFQLSRPEPTSNLQKYVIVFIDGQVAEDVDSSEYVPAFTQSAGSPEKESVADSQPIAHLARATFVVRVPDVAPRSVAVPVVLYSTTDQGWVPGATSLMQLGGDPGIFDSTSQRALLIGGLLGMLVAAGTFYYLITRSRRERRTFESMLETSLWERDSERKEYFLDLEAYEAKISQVRDQRGLLPNQVPNTDEVGAFAEPSVPNVPSYISEALTQKRLVLVLGGGASVQAGIPTGVSLWMQVLARMPHVFTEHDDPDPAEALRSALMKEGSSRAVEAIVETYGRVVIAKAVNDIFGGATTQRSAFHEQLAKIPCDLIVDLNFDSMTSQAFPRAEVFTPRRSEGLITAIRENRPCILKPFGDLREPKDLALTPSDLRLALSRAPEFERALAGAFSSHSHLFLGVSLQGLDEFLTMLPPSAGSTSRQHVAVIPHSPQIALWQAGPGRRYGIRIEPFHPSSEHRELVVMLERWLDATAQARATVQSHAELNSQHQPRLTRLALENIGAFERLELELSESWTLFLGNNGGGKSTVLRAVCVALAGNDPRAGKAAVKLLRNGSKSGRIQLEFGPDKIITELVRDAAGVRVDSPQVTPLQAGRLLVLAFPVLRGATHRVSVGPHEIPGLGPSVDDIAPLIEGVTDSRLDDLKQWIVNLIVQSDASSGGNASGMLTTLRSLIRELIPGQRVSLARVDRNTWTIWLETADGDVEFDAISQGMSSILNWVGVLLRRLYDVYPRSNEPEKERALVLIDEIDAHLHPSWQRRLVEITRQFFPNVQIVATSHSPLLAGAVKQEELRIVERNPASGKMTISTARENLEGQRAEDILVSSLFALETTRSPEAERVIKSYMSLFENPSLSEADKPQMMDLKKQMIALNYGMPHGSQVGRDPVSLDGQMEIILDALPDHLTDSIRSRLAGEASPHQVISSRSEEA